MSLSLPFQVLIKLTPMQGSANLLFKVWGHKYFRGLRAGGESSVACFVCVLYSFIVSWECGGMLIQGYVC